MLVRAHERSIRRAFPLSRRERPNTAGSMCMPRRSTSTGLCRPHGSAGRPFGHASLRPFLVCGHCSSSACTAAAEAAAQLATHRDRAAALLALAEKSVGLGFEGALALEAEAFLAGGGG